MNRPPGLRNWPGYLLRVTFPPLPGSLLGLFAVWAIHRLRMHRAPFLPFLCFVWTLNLVPEGSLFGHGAFHELLARLDSEIEARPDDAGLHVTRARLHLTHEDWQEALVDLERADRLDPTDAGTDGIRGAALNLACHWTAAESALSAHLELHPGDSEALFDRGRSRVGLGDHAAAMTDFRQALAAAPFPPEQVIEIANTAAACEGPEAARKILETELRRLDGDPALAKRAMELALVGGHFDAALIHLKALQLHAPRPEPWMARHAEILTQANRPAEARSAWTALRDHLMALPNLERGTATNQNLLQTARRALGESVIRPVIASPQSSRANPTAPPLTP